MAQCLRGHDHVYRVDLRAGVSGTSDAQEFHAVPESGALFGARCRQPARRRATRYRGARARAAQRTASAARGPNASGTKIAAAANEYPASLFKWTDLTNAYIHSVEDGAKRGLADLNELARLCPRASLVLSGYSEGADVIHRVMFDLSARVQRRVKAVVLYGDPFFDAREGYVKASGDYLPSQVGIWRQGAFAHHAIGARYRDETFSWCRRQDLVSQGVHAGISPFAPHMSYEALATRGAADQVLSRLGGSIRVRIEDATNYDHVTPIPPYGSGYGPPLPGATITLQPAPYQPLARCDHASVVSDAAGVATFTHCMPSRYLLASISKPGYATFTPMPRRTSSAYCCGRVSSIVRSIRSPSRGDRPA